MGANNIIVACQKGYVDEQLFFLKGQFCKDGWAGLVIVEPHAHIYVNSDFCFLYAATFYWNLTPIELNRYAFQCVILKALIWPNDTIAKWVTSLPSDLSVPGLSIRGQQWTGMLIL